MQHFKDVKYIVYLKMVVRFMFIHFDFFMLLFYIYLLYYWIFIILYINLIILNSYNKIKN